MSITCKDVAHHIEKIAPTQIAASWDNVGLQVGNYNKPVKKVLVALDITNKVIKHCIENNVDMIISHHPLIFSGLKHITTDDFLGNNIYSLIQNDICVYTAHTNMDAAKQGLNVELANMLKLKNQVVLEETSTYMNTVFGAGIIGELTQPESFDEFSATLKDLLDCPVLRYAGNNNKQIKKVALCTGSGADYMKRAYLKGADVYITGDLKHHLAIDVNEMDFLIIDAEHHFTEKIFEKIVQNYLNDFAQENGIEIETSSFEQSPIKYV